MNDAQRLAEAVDRIGGEGYCPGPLLVCAECRAACVFYQNGREHCSRCEKEVETLYKPVPKPVSDNLPQVEEWLLDDKDRAAIYAEAVVEQFDPEDIFGRLRIMEELALEIIRVMHNQTARVEIVLAAFEKVQESGEEKH